MAGPASYPLSVRPVAQPCADMFGPQAGVAAAPVFLSATALQKSTPRGLAAGATGIGKRTAGPRISEEPDPSMAGMRRRTSMLLGADVCAKLCIFD